jgi:hypothetical protein
MHCGVIQNPTTGNFWLLTAGGNTGSTLQTVVQYYDLTTSIGWTALTSLPSTVLYINDLMVISNKNAYIVSDQIPSGSYNTNKYVSLDYSTLTFSTKTFSPALRNTGSFE